MLFRPLCYHLVPQLMREVMQQGDKRVRSLYESLLGFVPGPQRLTQVNGPRHFVQVVSGSISEKGSLSP